MHMHRFERQRQINEFSLAERELRFSSPAGLVRRVFAVDAIDIWQVLLALGPQVLGAL